MAAPFESPQSKRRTSHREHCSDPVGAADAKGSDARGLKVKRPQPPHKSSEERGESRKKEEFMCKGMRQMKSLARLGNCGRSVPGSGEEVRMKVYRPMRNDTDICYP